MTITKKEIEKNVLTLEAQIDSATFLSYESKALERIGSHVEIPGFRKGNVPKDILVKHIGDMALLEEMAQDAIAEAYPKMLEEEKIDAIGRPEITITKIARGNPLAFTIRTSVMPEITLPDYKKIAKDIILDPAKEVSDEDVEKALTELRRMRAHEDMHIKMNEEGKTGHDHPELTDEMLPALDDAFAASLGGFTSVDDLRTKMKENMARENDQIARDKRRLGLFERMIETTDIDVPRILIDLELDKMLARLRADIERSGLSLDQYFTHLKKSESDIRGEWEVDAVKRAKMELLIDAIWRKEAFELDREILENEMKQIMGMYPDIDPLRAREYVGEMMKKQKVMSFLETL